MDFCGPRKVRCIPAKGGSSCCAWMARAGEEQILKYSQLHAQGASRHEQSAAALSTMTALPSVSASNVLGRVDARHLRSHRRNMQSSPAVAIRLPCRRAKSTSRMGIECASLMLPLCCIALKSCSCTSQQACV